MDGFDNRTSYTPILPFWKDRMPHGERKDRVRKMYDTLAGVYYLWRSATHPVNMKRILEKLAMNSKDTLVDVGTGPGIVPIKLRKLGIENPILGVDLSPKEIEIARHKASKLSHNHLTFEVGDMEKLPLPDASHSRLCCIEALLLLDCPEKALSEFHRVLKPGGKAVIVEPKNTGLSKKLFYAFFKLALKSYSLFRTEYKNFSETDFRGPCYFTREKLEYTMNSCRFEHISLEEDHTHFYCVLEKNNGIH